MLLQSKWLIFKSSHFIQTLFYKDQHFKQMCRLPELLLLPGRRINEYVTLLSWFELHTPSTHQDRGDLADAIETLKVVNRHVQEVGSSELCPFSQWYKLATDLNFNRVRNNISLDIGNFSTRDFTGQYRTITVTLDLYLWKT